MQDLIDQLEKLTGPDRESDVAIWVFITDPSTYRRIEPGKSYSTWQIKDRFGEWIEYYPALNAKPYTDSIDAARTLVPAGLHWSLTSRGVARVGGGGVEYMLKGGEHKHPAIALSIAALKARANIAGTAAQLEPWKSKA